MVRRQFEMKRCITAAVLTLAFLLRPTIDAKAQLGIQFGLDSGTKNTIDGLPDRFRIQMFKLLNDSIPVINTTVNGYIDHIDKVIKSDVDDAISQATCASNGALRNFSEGVKSSLVSAIVPDILSKSLVPLRVPTPNESLDIAIEQSRQAVHPDTPSRKIQLAYADLLHYASLVRCQATAAKAPPADFVVVDDQIQKLSGAVFEWTTLVNYNKCTTVDDCVIKRRAEVEALLESGDHRDIAFSQAASAFKKLQSPDPPTFLQRHYMSTFDILPYESILFQLRTVERGIAAAKYSRLSKADDLLAKGAVRQEKMLGSFASEASEMSNRTNDKLDFEQCIRQCSSLVDEIKAISDLIVEAGILDNDRKQMCVDRVAFLQTKLDLANALYNQSAAWLNQPRPLNGMIGLNPSATHYPTHLTVLKLANC
jgi:hypothetical protein